MAYEVSAKSIPAVAAIDLTTFQFHFGIYTGATITSGTTTLTAQGRVDGIIGEGVAAGESFPLVVPDGGVAMIKIGATLSAGALIATGADGKGLAQTGANGAMNWGVLLEGGADTEIVAMHFKYGGQVNA